MHNDNPTSTWMFKTQSWNELSTSNDSQSYKFVQMEAYSTTTLTVFQLHPCNKTLNSRNLGFAKDSFKVSFGFRTLSRPRLIKDTKNVKNHWFYCVFAQKCKKTIGFTVFSLKHVKKPLVLLCFRSKSLKKHWFYFVFAHKCWNTIGFILFSLTNITKQLVLLCFRSKMLKNQWFYCEKC